MRMVSQRRNKMTVFDRNSIERLEMEYRRLKGFYEDAPEESSRLWREMHDAQQKLIEARDV